MSFTNSTPFTGPFGCAFPGFTPSFSPTFAQGWNPNFSQAENQHFAWGTPNAWTPFNGANQSPIAPNFSNSPSPFGWNSTPWFNNPAWHNSFGPTSPSFSANPFTSNDPAWFNNFNTNNPAMFNNFNTNNPALFNNFNTNNPALFNNFNTNNPAWFGQVAPAHATHESFNTPFAAPPSWSPFGWNQNSSFSPWNSHFAPMTNTTNTTNSTPWFANPNFAQPTNAAQFQAPAPWFSPAFGGSSWFAPHNWANTPVNPAWAQPGTPVSNGNHANPTPYAVATPPNATTARDAA